MNGCQHGFAIARVGYQKCVPDHNAQDSTCSANFSLFFVFGHLFAVCE